MRQMKKSLIFGIAFLLIISIVSATTDEQLNNFFKMYSSNFQITTIWAGEATIPSGQVAKLSIVNLKWTDKEKNTFEERRFYANFRSVPDGDVVRHFDDGKNIETLMTYPQGTCKQKAPDGSCGVKSFNFAYLYDFVDNKYYYHRYNIEIDPATGHATGGLVKEIVTDATFTGKADIEDSPKNIQNKQLTLTFVNQNGIISEDTTTVYTAVGK